LLFHVDGEESESSISPIPPIDIGNDKLVIFESVGMRRKLYPVRW